MRKPENRRGRPISGAAQSCKTVRARRPFSTGQLRPDRPRPRESRRIAGPELGAIEIELFQNIDDALERQAPFLGPNENGQILHPGVRAVENHLEQQVLVANQRADQAKILGCEFAPAPATGQMFEALEAAEERPISPVPIAESPVPQIDPPLLALDPLVPFRFPQSFFVETGAFTGSPSLAKRANAESNQVFPRRRPQVPRHWRIFRTSCARRRRPE